MDAATIMVIVLTAGGVALLVWFEINSRRNCKKLQEHGRTGWRSNRGKKHLNVSPMCPRMSVRNRRVTVLWYVAEYLE
jgi:hypothetical protein